MIASGMNNREIGSALSITEGTVKVHVHHILTKLSVNCRTAAVSEGLRRRLLTI
jgi:DNA-binding NarL/FixJ family response regulator